MHTTFLDDTPQLSREVASLAENLTGTPRALGFTRGPHRLGVLVHACSHSSKEIEPRVSGVQEHPQLCREFKANLGKVKL